MNKPEPMSDDQIRECCPPFQDISAYQSLCGPAEIIAFARAVIAERDAQWAAIAAPQPQQEPWQDVIEQRILTWRQRIMNRSGDCLAIDDFMDQESIDDLVDFVCSPLAHPPEPAVQPKTLTDLQRLVTEQAYDEGLWFEARTAPEAHLQAALRQLHAAIERALEGK